jgi:hypothetical protein
MQTLSAKFPIAQRTYGSLDISASKNQKKSLHDLSSELLTSLGDNKYFKYTVDLSIGISLLSLFGSGLAEFKLLGLSKNSTKKLGFFADYANRTFQSLNALKNITTLFPRRDLMNAFAHALDFIMPALIPMNDFYLARGAPLGLYTGAHAMNIINRKEKFSSYGDYFQHLKSALEKSFVDFSLLKPGFLKRFLAHENAMMGMSSAALCLFGVGLWKPLEMILGPVGRSSAAFLRDTGGFFQALEGMKPGHFFSGRIFFGLSGYSQFIGAVCNLLAETVLDGYKSALDPLSFAFSDLGRWLFRISNDRGEAKGLVH